MKKFLAIAMIAGTMVACNNSGEGEKTDKDSIESVDSAANAQKDKIDSSADVKKDKVDSTAGAKKDSIIKNN